MRSDFRVTDWLNAPSPYEGTIGLGDAAPVPKRDGLTNLQVLSLLIANNGFRPRVTGWGNHSGPFGITQRDAFLLMEMGPYLQGLIDGAGLNSTATMKAYLEPELMRLAAEYEKLSAEATAEAEPAADEGAHVDDQSHPVGPERNLVEEAAAAS